MSTHYLGFHLEIENLSLKEKEWVEVRLITHKKDYLQFPDDEDEYQYIEFSYEFTDMQLDVPAFTLSIGTWDDEYGYPDGAAQLVCDFLKEFRPNECVTFSYSCWADRNRSGYFTGGAFIVTADWFTFMDTENWAQVRAEEYKKIKSTGRNVSMKNIESSLMMDSVLNK